MESALSPIRSGLRRLRHSASFQTLSSLAGPKKEVTPLDWWCVIALQACSMISILSTTYIFSTAVFMVRAWGATDEAKAAAHAGLMIATKPAFSALSSYVWGSLGDKVGFRITMLSSAAITAALTAALGAVDTFYLALVVRALSGFFDGVMTLSKSAMAKISDRTNSAKAFSTFGVNYGLGSTIGPTLSALLAYPCGGDPNAKKRGSDTNPMFGDWCPHHALREYPFLLSSAWVGVAAVFLWAFAFAYLRIPDDGVAGRAKADGGADAKSVEMTCAGGTSVAVVRGGGLDRGEGTHGAGKGAGKGEGEDDDEGEETTLLGSSPGSGTRGDVETGTTGAGRVPGDGDGDRGVGDGDRGVGGESAPAPWHKDECVRLATFSQVWCAFVVITGAELTPIWMATSRENGGLGFTAVDIGAFGSVMGVVILVFAATLFSFLADRFGVTRAVTWALAANGCIYLAHPLAWVAVTRSRALTWAIIGLFAVGRGCMGPVVMGGVSLILNNSAPRASLGAVNGFAGMFTNLARAGAPIFGGALVAGMVHATRKLVRERNEGDGEGFEFDVAEAVPPTWWPFVLLSLCFFALSRGAARMPKSLDNPRTT